MSVSPFNRNEFAAYAASVVWALCVSKYCRALTDRSAEPEGEALIGFGIWAFFVWWLSKRYGTGWSIYAFALALIIYAPFADHIDASFGGALGLRD